MQQINERITEVFPQGEREGRLRITSGFIYNQEQTNCYKISHEEQCFLLFLSLLFLSKQVYSERFPLTYKCRNQEIKRPVITCNHSGFSAGDSGGEVASMEEGV